MTAEEIIAKFRVRFGNLPFDTKVYYVVTTLKTMMGPWSYKYSMLIPTNAGTFFVILFDSPTYQDMFHAPMKFDDAKYSRDNVFLETSTLGDMDTINKYLELTKTYHKEAGFECGIGRDAFKKLCEEHSKG